MARRRLITNLFASHLLVVLITVIALGWYGLSTFERFHLRQTSQHLETLAKIIREQIGPVEEVDPTSLNELIREIGSVAETRITIIATDGMVLADSEEDPVLMDNHGDRPEVVQVFGNGLGYNIRYSYTLEQDMMYLALPLYTRDRIVGIVRTSLPLGELRQAVVRLRSQVTFMGLLIVVVAALISYTVSRRLSRPLEAMRRGAESFARGDFEGHIEVPGTEELAGLAESLNEMARQLDRRISTITRQRNEQEAMLSSMIEGVLAVDAKEHIIRINQAATRIFELDLDNPRGRPIQEVIRHAALQRFVQQTLSGNGEIEEELVVLTDREIFLQASGTLLHDAAGNRIGALVVLNDITRLKQLEAVRREFVANVSHELKTPITSIKGFVETLASGEPHPPEDTERFLGIIARHTDRLNSIIDDLLTLSRIEQQETDTRLEFTVTRLQPLLADAIQSRQAAAEERELKIELRCGQDIEARVNAPLLEQALVNLIDNALKYGNKGGQLTVSVDQNGGIVIRVADDGPGIAAEHLPHLFTRFYRIDKGRSRAEGGTGLGLAIVKHITLAHGGTVDVESTPGTGSSFIIRLPLS